MKLSLLFSIPLLACLPGISMAGFPDKTEGYYYGTRAGVITSRPNSLESLPTVSGLIGYGSHLGPIYGSSIELEAVYAAPGSWSHTAYSLNLTGHFFFLQAMLGFQNSELRTGSTMTTTSGTVTGFGATTGFMKNYSFDFMFLTDSAKISRIVAGVKVVFD